MTESGNWASLAAGQRKQKSDNSLRMNGFVDWNPTCNIPKWPPWNCANPSSISTFLFLIRSNETGTADHRQFDWIFSSHWIDNQFLSFGWVIFRELLTVWNWKLERQGNKKKASDVLVFFFFFKIHLKLLFKGEKSILKLKTLLWLFPLN